MSPASRPAHARPDQAWRRGGLLQPGAAVEEDEEDEADLADLGEGEEEGTEESCSSSSRRTKARAAPTLAGAFRLRDTE